PNRNELIRCTDGSQWLERECLPSNRRLMVDPRFLRGAATPDVDSVSPVSSSERVEALTIAPSLGHIGLDRCGSSCEVLQRAFVSEDHVALRWGDRSPMTALNKRESCEGACCPLHRLLTAADRSDTSNGFRRVHGMPCSVATS